MKINKLLTKTKKGTSIESFYGEEKRNIIIIKNRKKTENGHKNYYSYQLNLPLDMLLLYTENIPQSIFYTYLQEKNKQSYDLILSPSEIDDAIKIKLPVDDKKRNVPITLPKKHIEYLQAYDTYQDVLEVINQEIKQKNQNAKNDNEKIEPFEVQPLIATITIYTNIDETEQVTTENVTEPYLKCIIDKMNITIKAYIDDRFVKYAEEDNKNMGGIPSWLETLLIDWEHEKFNETVGIESNVNKWKYGNFRE